MREPTSCCWPAASESRSSTPPRTCWPVTPGSRRISQSWRERTRSKAWWELPGGKELWDYHFFYDAQHIMCHCRTELFMTLVIKGKDNVFGLLHWEQIRLCLKYRQLNRELQIVNFECKHLSKLQFCCVLNCALYCRCRDPVSAERLACGATIAISGEDLKRNRLRIEMLRIDISVFLTKACVFHWCGAIRTTSTTEEVSSFLVFVFSLQCVDDLLFLIVRRVS